MCQRQCTLTYIQREALFESHRKGKGRHLCKTKIWHILISGPTWSFHVALEDLGFKCYVKHAVISALLCDVDGKELAVC